MKITKYGHACILVEVNGVALLVDPGNWNETPVMHRLDAILVTHEHQDHCDVAQIKGLMEKHTGTIVITHAAVGKLLEEAGVGYNAIENGGQVEVNGVPVESCGTDHAIIYGDTSPCQNTGFLINEELFVPGDALHDVPGKPVRVLALPTGGPWMRISEAIDYAKQVKPQIAFPIHDAMYTEMYRNALVPRLVGGNLEAYDIAMVNLQPGEAAEF